jgi:hypothetical protein
LEENVCALEQFTIAHALAEPPVEPMLINNLAASQIGLGLESEAVDMLDLALKRKDLDDYTRSLLEFNRFHALASMNDLAKANKAFDRIAPSLESSSLQASQFKSLIRFCLIQNTQDKWLLLEPLLSESLENLDPHLVFPEGDPTAMLFSAYDDQWAELGIEDTGDVRWRTIKNLHRTYYDGIKAYAQSLLEERNALAKANFSPKTIVPLRETNFMLLGVSFALLLLGGSVLFLRSRKRQMLTANKSTEAPANNAATIQILEQVERMAKDGDANLQALISDLRSGELEKLQTIIQERTQSLSLTEIERQALALFIHGYTGKQVAQMLDRSPGYMYNMRSKLRKTLSLQENQDFQDWHKSKRTY